MKWKHTPIWQSHAQRMLKNLLLTWIVAAPALVMCAEAPMEVAATLANTNIHWASSSNGLRVGISPPTRSEATDARLVRFLYLLVIVNTDTNRLPLIFLPNHEQRFSISLRDERGQEVPKTKEGQSVGKPLPKSPESRYRNYSFFPLRARTRMARFKLRPGETYQLDRFDVMQYFKISQAGKYALTIEARVFRNGPNGELMPLVFPSFSVPLDIGPADIPDQ